jgi:hypothetical protein
MTRGVAVVVLAVVIAAGLPSAAEAIAPCPGASTAITPVLAGQGVLESVIVDARGRLYYTDTTAKELRRLEAPGAAPETIAAGIDDDRLERALVAIHRADRGTGAGARRDRLRGTGEHRRDRRHQDDDGNPARHRASTNSDCALTPSAPRSS